MSFHILSAQPRVTFATLSEDEQAYKLGKELGYQQVFQPSQSALDHYQAIAVLLAPVSDGPRHTVLESAWQKGIARGMAEAEEELEAQATDELISQEILAEEAMAQGGLVRGWESMLEQMTPEELSQAIKWVNEGFSEGLAS